MFLGNWLELVFTSYSKTNIITHTRNVYQICFDFSLNFNLSNYKFIFKLLISF